MRKPFLVFLVLFVVGAIIGSVITYNYYVKQPVSTEAKPSQPVINIAPGKSEIIGENSIVNAVKRISPAVVFITTKAVFSQTENYEMPPGVPEEFKDLFKPFDAPQQRQGSGSGVIISPDGYILTNQHVIEGAQQISVKLDGSANGGKEKTFPAKVIGADRMTDIAVVKIDGKNLPAASLGDSDAMQIGEWVIAVGNPYGYEHTVTVGVLSAKGRSLEASGLGREYPNLLQTDAAINPGNSGGPLANLKGEIIGINTAILRQGQGIGFAIAINKVKSIKDQLITSGKIIRPFVGIKMMEMDEAKARYLEMPLTEGVLVYGVLTQSPAANAGMRRGDVILEINGIKVNSPKELQEQIRKHKAGEKIKFKIWRDKKKIDVELIVGEMPSQPDQNISEEEQ